MPPPPPPTRANYQTPNAKGVEDTIPDDLPPNEYYEYFKPDYKLHLQVRSFICIHYMMHY